MNELTSLHQITAEACIIGEGPSKAKALTFLDFFKERSVACINRSGITWPLSYTYWITYHSEWLSRWWADREMLKLPLPTMAIVSANKKVDLSHIPHYNVTRQVHGLNTGGTSAILAAMVLLDIGYKPIHLFGVDLTKKYAKDRKFWRILQDEPLIFHGEDWFHTRKFSGKEEE